MNKKEYIAPLLIAGLSILFAGICLVLFFNGGKSEKWIRRKMKIGALLLTFTAFTQGMAQEEDVIISCYEPASPDTTLIEFFEQTEIVLKAKNGLIIKQNLNYKLADNYSFCLVNRKKETLQKGNIKINTLNNNDWEISVNIELKVNFNEGNYFLQIFDVPFDKQEPKRMKESLLISVKK